MSVVALDVASAAIGMYKERQQAGQNEEIARDIIRKLSHKIEETKTAIINEIQFQNLQDLEGHIAGLGISLNDYLSIHTRDFLNDVLSRSGEVLGEASIIVRDTEHFDQATKAYPLYLNLLSIRSIIWEEVKHFYSQSASERASIDNNINSLLDEAMEISDNLINEASKKVQSRFGEIDRHTLISSGYRYFYTLDGEIAFRSQRYTPFQSPPDTIARIMLDIKLEKEKHMQEILDTSDEILFRLKEELFNLKNKFHPHGHWDKGWTSIERFEIGPNQYLFLNKFNGTETAINKIDSDLNSHRVWGIDSWTPGWTSIVPFGIASKDFVFIYKKDGSKTAIYEISTLTAHKVKVYDPSMPRGYTSFVPFKISGSGKLYLLAYNVLSGKVIIDKINSDGTEEGTNSTNVWEDSWTRGWTSIKLFKMNQNQYLLLYKFFEGQVKIDKIEPNGVGTSNVWEDSWTKAWTSIVPFTYNQQPHLFLYKCWEGDVVISKINSNGNGTTNIKRFRFTPGWTSIVPFKLNGKIYMFMYKVNSGTRGVMSISDII